MTWNRRTVPSCSKNKNDEAEDLHIICESEDVLLIISVVHNYVPSLLFTDKHNFKKNLYDIVTGEGRNSFLIREHYNLNHLLQWDGGGGAGFILTSSNFNKTN